MDEKELIKILGEKVLESEEKKNNTEDGDLRKEIADIANAICDLIDSAKHFVNVFDASTSIPETMKEIMKESMKDTVIKFMYGDNAYVGTRFRYPYYYRNERNGEEE